MSVETDDPLTIMNSDFFFGVILIERTDLRNEIVLPIIKFDTKEFVLLIVPESYFTYLVVIHCHCVTVVLIVKFARGSQEVEILVIITLNRHDWVFILMLQWPFHILILKKRRAEELGFRTTASLDY
jgi:hypothetical protein